MKLLLSVAGNYRNLVREEGRGIVAEFFIQLSLCYTLTFVAD